ncbi:hypothetical protein ACQPX6_17775 [Actinomycetospora sp. CA-101289]|uniref:hypothetical protein n=1 Tax=Actinomycetospora sp. CA-101289 TaxID=3239893 RepID=UPI003D97F3BD
MTVPGPPRPGPPGAPALDELRAAAAALPEPTEGDTDGDIDAADHAARFEAVHDALVAVLADVDGT